MSMHTCANCGTEVDEEAAFCPSCGQSLAPAASTPSAPPAPAWHPDEEEPGVADGQPAAAWSRPDSVEEVEEVEVPTQPRAEEPPREPVAPPRGSTPAVPPSGASQVNLPFTWPVTLSSWLVGGGAFIGALALFVDFRLFSNPITIVLLVLLLAVAATVFLASAIPAIAYLQLMVMATIFAGLGVALDRIGFGSVGGIGSAILLLAMIVAATGVIIAETGRDRPWAGPGQG